MRSHGPTPKAVRKSDGRHHRGTAQATGHVMRAVRVVWEGLPWEAGLGVLASSGEERGALRGLQGSLLSV